jgi:F-type H+-transporting ATPase subunit delta
VSTSEAQIIARALFDSLTGQALAALRTASSLLETTNGQPPEQRLVTGLPEQTPREVRNLLLALVKEGKTDQLPAVTQAFERFAQGGTAQLTGDIISAVALDEAQQKRITEQLREQYGDGLVLRFIVDPSLIGGLIIRIGDQVLDNSLRTRLSAVQRDMLAG